MSRNFLIALIILAVLLLAAAALFVQSQGPGAGATADRLGHVARAIARGEDRVTVPDLTRQLVEERRDFVLVDLRSAEEFEAGHIPGASRSSLTDILQPNHARSMARGRNLILYSERTDAAAQAAALLRVVGVDARALQGGFDYWLRYTRDPGCCEIDGDALTLSRAERQAIACYFHGEYMPSAGIPIQPPITAAYTPAVAPVQPTAAPVAAAPAPAAPADPLGLGLGLGVGTVAPAAPTSQPAADPLGLGLGLGVGTVAPAPTATAPAQADPLGLGLGLGVGTVTPPQPAAPAAVPEAGAAPPRRPGLRVGQGC